MLRRGLGIVVRLLIIVHASLAWAGSYAVSSNVGLMQQPTSHYYHEVYGVSGEVGFWDQKVFLRGTYLERPRFVSAGFADQEQGGFAFVGTKLTGPKEHGLSAMVGGGKMNGYIVVDRDRFPNLDAPERAYHLTGMALGLEYSARWKGIELGAGHQTFIGYVDEDQLKSYVAWPYNFYLVHLGMVL